MADPIQQPDPNAPAQTPRMLALKNLAANLPAANSQIAQGQKAAQQMQLQQAVAAAPPSTKTTQAAQGIGAQQAGQAGQQMIETATKETGKRGLTSQLGHQVTQEEQLESQKQVAGLKQGSQEQQLDNVEKFAKISEKAKQDLYDKQMQFHKDENGRTVFNEEQLADYKRTAAQGSEDFKNYSQSADQINQRNLEMMKQAYRLVDEDMTQKYNEAKAKGNFETMKQIQQDRSDMNDRMAREKARAQNSNGIWSTGGTVVGGVVGAVFGGPAGAAVGMSVGGAAGSAIGNMV